MPARYERLPNPSSGHDPEGELEAAFELNDDDEDHDPSGNGRSPALTINTTTTTMTTIPPPLGSAGKSGGYDFERQDYDFPPPGSPPPPTSRALPNDFGNSNGIVPSSPAVSHPPRPSFLQRALGVFLPSQYSRLATSESSSRPVGGGTENDGVFANVAAKPQPGRVVQSDDGNMFVVPEEVQKELPPSYAEAQADAVPPYWETTIHAPASLEPGADMIIDGLPTGTFIIFALNFIISWFFQFIGFFLTYMLHTSHAAKFGSRAGLGMTLIQFGFYSRQQMQEEQQQQMVTGLFGTVNTTMSAATENPDGVVPQNTSQTSRDWLSFLFMTLGWFLLLSSTVGFWRVKRWESSLRAPPPPDPTDPQEIERDQAIRRNIANVFGITIDDDDIHINARFNPNEITPQHAAAMAAEARLTRDLRAAGLL